MSAVVVCVLLTGFTVASALGLMVTTIQRDCRRNAELGAVWEAELARRTRRRQRKEQPRAISAGGAQ